MDAIPGYRTIAALLLIMVALQLANSLSGYSLNTLALLPRSPGGLPGLLLSPWLHASWLHLLGNLLPFAVLSAIVLRDGAARYLSVSATAIVLGGLLVWCFGRHAIHVGASGWIFGLWAYILASAWYHRSLANLVAALCVVGFYGGMLFGLLPRHGVSFESHLAGSLAGIVAARMLVPRRQPAQSSS